MIKTIVVATDGSDHAKKAIDLAVDMAEKYSARMVILHVLLRHTSDTHIESLCQQNAMPKTLEDKFAELRKAFIEMASAAMDPGPVSVPIPDDVLNEVGELILNNARTRAESKGVTEITTRILDGAPADMIVAAAENENADLIVMGSRGLGNLAGLLMGSVSHKVSHMSTCTCVTVK